MMPSAFDIAAGGMAAHRAEIDIIAQNLANAGTERVLSGEPYRARAAVFEPVPSGGSSTFADALDAATTDFSIDLESGGDEADAPAGVRLASIAESDAPPEYRYEPTSPLAIASGPKRGYVAIPNVDPIGPMTSLVSAGRAYDADVAALQAAKQMDVEAIEVDRS